MGGISLSIHPLFFLFGMYYALNGKIFVFIIYTVSAVVHELGHSLVASECGYKLNKIKLMPFGAVVSGCFDDVRLIDEVKIALAGPFINLAVGLFFVAIWWVFPNLYAFTDLVAQANFSLFLINVLPAYPLDGGRVLNAFLKQRVKEKTARIISVATGACLTAIMLALFIVSLFSTPNYSILFFASFVLMGALSKDKDNRYVKIYSGVGEKKLALGLPVKIHAVSKKITIKRLIAIFDLNAVNEVQVFDGQKLISTLDLEKINNIVQSAGLYDKLENYL